MQIYVRLLHTFSFEIRFNVFFQDLNVNIKLIHSCKLLEN